MFLLGPCWCLVWPAPWRAAAEMHPVLPGFAEPHVSNTQWRWGLDIHHQPPGPCTLPTPGPSSTREGEGEGEHSDIYLNIFPIYYLCAPASDNKYLVPWLIILAPTFFLVQLLSSPEEGIEKNQILMGTKQHLGEKTVVKQHRVLNFLNKIIR